MAHYLIAGFAGSGKSTIAHALQARGLPALDSDEVVGLSSWRQLADNQPVTVDYDKPINFEAIGWLWDKVVLQQTLADNPDLFLCGNAHNLWDYANLFDAIFALDVDPDRQRERITSRTDNIYAQEPETLERTLRNQYLFIQQAKAFGAYVINANAPIDVVVEQILSDAAHIISGGQS